MTAETLLRASGVSKSYGGVEVLHGVDFELRAGERVALIGENGAGKSTFAKILVGAVMPDSGEVQVGGRPVRFTNPRVALRAGIAFIPQELAYVPELTVAENIMLGQWPGRLGTTSRNAIIRRAAEEAKRYGIGVDLTAKMSALKLADQQIVEVLKALTRRARVIVLDEPTAPLTAHESSALFEVLDELAAGGVGILYISHRMDEVSAMSDRVDVFRNGSKVASVPTAQTSHGELIGHMLGKLAPTTGPRDFEPVRERLALALRGWTVDSIPRLEGVDLALWSGEVLAVFGVRGSGAELIAEGLGRGVKGLKGELALSGRPVPLVRNARDAQRLGLGYVPPDRKHDGLVLTMDVKDNLTLTALKGNSTAGVLSPRRVNASASAMATRFDVRSTGLRQLVGTLSGGNQQKVLLANRMATQPDVLVLHEPTRGVDVGARAQIHDFLRAEALRGAAVLVVTSDVEEAVNVSDRLVVITDGCVAAELTGAEKTQAAALAAAAETRNERIR